MADKMCVNVPPHVGEYDFDIGSQPLSTLEWRWIKRISGYLPLTMEDGLKGGDPDLLLAWAVIAMVRAHAIREDEVFAVADHIAHAPVDGDSITFRGEAEDDAVPPTLEKPSESDGASEPSGEASSESGELYPENGSQGLSGIPASVIGSDSNPVT